MSKRKNKSDEELLEKEGWQITCQSPFEIENSEGGFANQEPAVAYINSLRFGIKYKKTKNDKMCKKAREICEDLHFDRISEADFIRKMVDLFKK